MTKFRAARTTPRGLHENLYPHGLVFASGAGKPPQYERNPTIFPPFFFASSIIFIAVI